MITITKLVIPPHIEEPLTEYVNNILQHPSRYIIQPSRTNDTFNMDVNDPRHPGLDDEFVKNWDLNNIYWGGFNLQTNKCDNLATIAYPPMSISIPLIDHLEETLQKTIIRPTGNFLYPTGGYMGWHTNGNMPGVRVYLAYSPVDHGSYFKYVDRSTNTVITDWDDKGWTVRAFEVSQYPYDFFWHCVGAPNAPRISFGYWFKK